MSDLLSAVRWCIANYDLIALFVGFLLAVMKLTKWGKANAAALDAIISVIEARGDKKIKNEVRDLDLQKDARQAIERKVEKHQG